MKFHIPKSDSSQPTTIPSWKQTRIFSVQDYTFSIPSVAKTPYLVKITRFPGQVTRQFTSGSHLCSLFVLVRKSPTWKVWKRLSDVCYNGRAWEDINFIPRSINYWLVSNLLKNREHDRLKWNDPNKSTLYFNRALWFATYFTLYFSPLSILRTHTYTAQPAKTENFTVDSIFPPECCLFFSTSSQNLNLVVDLLMSLAH